MRWQGHYHLGGPCQAYRLGRSAELSQLSSRVRLPHPYSADMGILVLTVCRFSRLHCPHNQQCRLCTGVLGQTPLMLRLLGKRLVRLLNPGMLLPSKR